MRSRCVFRAYFQRTCRPGTACFAACPEQMQEVYRELSDATREQQVLRERLDEIRRVKGRNPRAEWAEKARALLSSPN